MPLELGLFLIASIIAAAIVYQFDQEKRKRLEQERRVRALQLSDVDNMTGHQFEHYVSKLLAHQGFTTQVTVASGDLGVDVLAHKATTKYAIQVKRQAQNVSRRAISDAVAGCIHYKCTNAMVVTNAYFTAGAQELANSTGCRLVDRNELTQWILSFQQAQTKPIYNTPNPMPTPLKSQINVGTREYLNFDGENYCLRNPGPVVYMLAHGDREEYKIGFTKDINSRVDKVDLQLPERVWVVHKIYTNDPKWLEQIWHKRFAIKRKNGEWFDLSPEDILEFRKHQETNNPELDCPSQLLLPIDPRKPSFQFTPAPANPLPVQPKVAPIPAQPKAVPLAPTSDREAAIQRVKTYFDSLKIKHPEKAGKLTGAYTFQINQLNSELMRMRAGGRTQAEAIQEWEKRACRSADMKVQ